MSILNAIVEGARYEIFVLFWNIIFSGATPEEITHAKNKLEELKSSPGGVKSFLNDHDDFKHYGCGTIITAVKK